MRVLSFNSIETASSWGLLENRYIESNHWGAQQSGRLIFNWENLGTAGSRLPSSKPFQLSTSREPTQ